MMDMYHIPGDTGKPWRFNKMVEYIGNFPDEIGPVINYYLESARATNDDKMWWVFLYSTCYCMGTAMVMANHLDHQSVDDDELERYWVSTKPKLIFQSDRRYIKNMNQFTWMAHEFLNRSGRQLYDYIMQFVKLGDAKTTYSQLYKEISSWKYYGRFGTILFIFNLCKVFPQVEIESSDYDWKSGATTTSAIFNARYEDERAADFDAKKVNLTSDDIRMLNATLKLVSDALKQYNPNKKWNDIYVTSDLCSFRKLFKGVRYQGYYVDRQMEELQQLQHNFPELSNMWDITWDARRRFINPQYLGEVNGWRAIRKHRMKWFLEHGYVGGDPDVCW